MCPRSNPFLDDLYEYIHSFTILINFSHHQIEEKGRVRGGAPVTL